LSRFLSFFSFLEVEVEVERTTSDGTLNTSSFLPSFLPSLSLLLSHSKPTNRTLWTVKDTTADEMK